jgi:hypothetical protein
MNPPPTYTPLDRSDPFGLDRFAPWQEATMRARAAMRAASDALPRGDNAALAAAVTAEKEFDRRHQADLAFMHGYYHGRTMGTFSFRRREMLYRARLLQIDESGRQVAPEFADDRTQGIAAGLLDAARRADLFDAQLAIDIRQAASDLVDPSGAAS